MSGESSPKKRAAAARQMEAESASMVEDARAMLEEDRAHREARTLSSADEKSIDNLSKGGNA